MKVTVIPTIRHYAWGAPGKCLGALVEELLAVGHEVQLFVTPIDMNIAEVAELKALGARIEELPDPERDYATLRGPRRWLDRITGRSRKLTDMVRAFGPGHVFMNQGATWCVLHEQFSEVLSGYTNRYSLICHSNSSEIEVSEEQVREADRLASNARKMFFNSRWTKAQAESQIGRGIPNASCFQILPGANFHLIEWPKPTDAARLAMVTRLDCQVKGIDLAIDAVARVNQNGLRVRLDIFGEGADKEPLQKRILNAGGQAAVTLKGGLRDPSQVWRDHELLLMPSRKEGLGLSMLEAMSCARPVLRTPLGGCEEWIEDGVNGFVCPRADVAALVETLEKALAARDRWREMGLAANAKIKRDLHPHPGRVFLEALRP